MDLEEIILVQLTWLVWILLVEVNKKFHSMLKVFRRFPSLGLVSVFPTKPSDYVLDFVSLETRIEDLRDLVFFISFNFDRRRRWLLSLRKGVWVEARQKTCMKHVVNSS